jgi:hypothetical protein
MGHSQPRRVLTDNDLHFAIRCFLHRSATRCSTAMTVVNCSPSGWPWTKATVMPLASLGICSTIQDRERSAGLPGGDQWVGSGGKATTFAGLNLQAVWAARQAAGGTCGSQRDQLNVKKAPYRLQAPPRETWVSKSRHEARGRRVAGTRSPRSVVSSRANEGRNGVLFGIIFGWFTAGVIYGAALWFHPWDGQVLRMAASELPCSSGEWIGQVWTASAGPLDKDEGRVATADQKCSGRQWAMATTR